jgi:hypothetical protein
MIRIVIDEPFIFAAATDDNGMGVVMMQRDGYVVSWERMGDVVEGPTLARSRTLKECVSEWIGCVHLASVEG